MPIYDDFSACPALVGISGAPQGTITLTGLATGASCRFSLVAFPPQAFTVSCPTINLGAGSVLVSIQMSVLYSLQIVA